MLECEWFFLLFWIHLILWSECVEAKHVFVILMMLSVNMFIFCSIYSVWERQQKRTNTIANFWMSCIFISPTLTTYNNGKREKNVQTINRFTSYFFGFHSWLSHTQRHLHYETKRETIFREREREKKRVKILLLYMWNDDKYATIFMWAAINTMI